ncbi:MAG: methylated-DNA--[protein]-cysteine S-methyltransferase [Archaeoglobaceae archaeon]
MTLDSFSLEVTQIFSPSRKLFLSVFLEDEAVSRVEFSSTPHQEHLSSQTAERLKKDVERYLQGYKIDFSDYSLRLSDTTGFLQKVLNKVRRIPYGETVTYGELAKKLNSGPRAIGQAMKRNPIPIIIPCHRVIASNGLGGYSSGVEIKKQLLKLELKNNY